MSTELHQFVPLPYYARMLKCSVPYLTTNSPFFCPFSSYIISLSCPSFYLSYLFNVYIESLPIASVHAVFLCSSCLLFLHREKRIQCGFRLFVFIFFYSVVEELCRIGKNWLYLLRASSAGELTHPDILCCVCEAFCLVFSIALFVCGCFVEACFALLPFKFLSSFCWYFAVVFFFVVFFLGFFVFFFGSVFAEFVLAILVQFSLGLWWLFTVVMWVRFW